MAEYLGAPGELQKDATWTKLVKAVEKNLAARSKASVRAALEVVTIAADAVAVSSWDGDPWIERDPVVEGATTSTTRSVPVVELRVQTKAKDSAAALEPELDDLALHAVAALDTMAFEGVGDSGQVVPPIILSAPVASLNEAMAAVPDYGRVVLHAGKELPDWEQKSIKRRIGPGDLVHCPYLDGSQASYVLLAAERAQLRVAQDWRLSYVPEDRLARLVLTFRGVYVSRPASAVRFSQVFGA